MGPGGLGYVQLDRLEASLAQASFWKDKDVLGMRAAPGRQGVQRNEI